MTASLDCTCVSVLLPSLYIPERNTMLLSPALSSSFASALRFGSRTLALLLLTLSCALYAADPTPINKGGKMGEYGVASGQTGTDVTQAGTRALYGNAAGVSAMVWGPIVAIVLGIVVVWMIIAINKGGVFAAVNSIVALIVGGVAMAIIYTMMIAPAAA